MLDTTSRATPSLASYAPDHRAGTHFPVRLIVTRNRYSSYAHVPTLLSAPLRISLAHTVSYCVIFCKCSFLFESIVVADGQRYTVRIACTFWLFELPTWRSSRGIPLSPGLGHRIDTGGQGVALYMWVCKIGLV